MNSTIITSTATKEMDPTERLLALLTELPRILGALQAIAEAINEQTQKFSVDGIVMK